MGAPEVALPPGFVLDAQLPPGFVLDGAKPPEAKVSAIPFAVTPLVTAPKSARQWSDVPGEAISNIPSSAGNLLSGLYQAVRHPLDTAGNIADVAAGGLQNAVGTIFPTVANQINALAPSPANQRTRAAANAVGQLYQDRYGSLEGIKNTLATDPVGAAADLSTVLSGGAALATKGGQVSNALQQAARYTNPINAAAPVVKGIGKVIEAPASNLLGLTTGVGAENIRAAARSGLEGKKDFWSNLTGKADFNEVLQQAKNGLAKMGETKSAQYRSGMVDIKNDKAILNFNNIDDAVKNAADTVNFKGQVKNAKGAEVQKRIASVVEKWKKLDPAEYHTPEGLDALKQRIGGIVESIPFEEKTARMVGNNIYHSIKGEISKQAPTYSKVMKEYSDASDSIKEIERALSLGNKAMADTAMRKLQSLSRNNVNSNYGNRLQLAKELEAKGGVELMPAIAGQAMNSWVGRGLSGRAGGLATLAAGVGHNPLIFGALPFQSPRVMGAAAYGGGQAARGLLNAADYFPSPTQGLLMYQAGQLPNGSQ